jgi:hypothetical protein
MTITPTSSAIYLGDLILKEVIKIAVPPTMETAQRGLLSFIKGMHEGEDIRSGALPSAALLGLGRCGSNICTELARQLEAALADQQTDSDKVQSDVVRRLREFIGMLPDRNRHPYLFQPVILLADADYRMAQADEMSQEVSIVPGYTRCRRIDLDWLFKNGCGNVPQVGQYLARVLLKKTITDADTQSKSDARKNEKKFAAWEAARSFLLDTVGMNENPSRLMITVFSTGGGTGSGLSIEFGAAQKFLMMKRAVESSSTPNREQKLHLESCFSLGVAVMPVASDIALVGDKEHDQTNVGPEAQSVNTGRSLIAYLARLERSRRADPKNQVVSDADMVPFDCQLLVSNSIMASMASEPKTPFSDAARAANVYISQHLSNLLLAQSLPADYGTVSSADPGARKLLAELRAGGIESGELGSLDPGDLKNSLYGLSVAGYAESKKLQDFDMEALVVQAVSPPTWNNDTRSIDGVSVLPETLRDYSQKFSSSQSATVRPSETIDSLVSKVPLFRKAVSVVTVVGVPNSNEGILKATHVRILKESISRLFPCTSIRRYVVIPDASDRLSLGLIICGAGYLTSECLHHIYNYLFNCFCIGGVENSFIQKLEAFLTTPEDDGTAFCDMLLEFEDLGPVLAGLGDAGGFVQKRAELEARSAVFLGDKAQFQEVLINRTDVTDALQFIRHGIAFKGLRKPPLESILNRIP